MEFLDFHEPVFFSVLSFRSGAQQNWIKSSFHSPCLFSMNLIILNATFILTIYSLAFLLFIKAGLQWFSVLRKCNIY